MSSVYAFWAGELTFSAKHTAIDNRFERFCIATFAKQYGFSQIKICEMSCRTGCCTCSARDTSGCAGFFFQQFFVQFGIGYVQIYCGACVSFVSKIFHSYDIKYEFTKLAAARESASVSGIVFGPVQVPA